MSTFKYGCCRCFSKKPLATVEEYSSILNAYCVRIEAIIAVRFTTSNYISYFELDIHFYHSHIRFVRKMTCFKIKMSELVKSEALACFAFIIPNLMTCACLFIDTFLTMLTTTYISATTSLFVTVWDYCLFLLLFPLLVASAFFLTFPLRLRLN